MDGRPLHERTLAVLDGWESACLGYGGFAGRMSSAGRAGVDTAALLDGTQLDERRMGGRVLEWNTVALLEKRQLDERRMGGRVLDWDTAALLDGRPLNERTLAVLDGRESA